MTPRAFLRRHALPEDLVERIAPCKCGSAAAPYLAVEIRVHRVVWSVACDCGDATEGCSSAPQAVRAWARLAGA